MKRKWLAVGISTFAVVLLVLGSLTNVVGYQTVQASNQKIISTEINSRELLFQTILDIGNNKEIQKVFLGSEITGKGFLDIGIRFSVFTPPVLTEKFLKHAYTMGVILSKTIGKSKMHSLLERYPVSNQGMQKEINAVIEKDTSLKNEIMQLSSLSCDCNNGNTSVWDFPVICRILLPLFIIFFDLAFSSYGISLFFFILFGMIDALGSILHCYWY